MAYSPDHFLDPASAAPFAAPVGPPWPNPLASIAYASCRPADCEPPAEDSALTSRAAYERLNRAAARAETLVLYRLDMLAGCRDSLDVDQTRLEASVQNLWRLTAVRKTLLSIEAVLNAPASTTPPPAPSLQDLTKQCEAILKSITEEASISFPAPDALTPSTSALASPIPAVSAPSSPTPSESVSVRVGPCSSVPSPSPAQSIPSTASTSSIGSIESIASIPPVSKSPSLQVPPSSSVAPSPCPPVSMSSSLSIRAVPSCPRLSLSSVSRTLDRVNADMANYPEHVSTAADYNFNVTAEEFLRPAIKSAPTSSLATANPIVDAAPDLSPSLSNIPHSAFRTPHSPSPQVSPSSSPRSALHTPPFPPPPD